MGRGPLTRREWLRVGGVGLGGLSLAEFFRARAAAAESPAAPTGRAKAVIVLWFSGGVPQHETWDPKPEAPAEIRGEFGAIASRTPGLCVGELMPQTAQLTDKIAVVRTLATGDNAHSSSGYQMLTGVPHIPLSRENALPGKPNDSPSINALVRTLRTSRDALPAAITLPRRLANVGEKVWPGQDAGFLGQSYNPWLLTCDPSSENFDVPGCALPDEIPPLRLDRRLALREQFNRHLDLLARSEPAQRFDSYAGQALELLSGGQARNAFDLHQETEATRERYGRNPFGQSVLLARRLVEAGVSLVQVNWPRLDGKENGGGWDTHEVHSKCLKGWLMPMMDQTYSALIEDLAVRGLLEETVVCWVGEFGHTPKINAKAGRDHWGRVFSIALAGGGIRGGAIYGATDRHAGEARTDVVRPCDYLATVFHCLGYSPDTAVHDVTGRPLPLTRGQVIEPLVA